MSSSDQRPHPLRHSTTANKDGSRGSIRHTEQSTRYYRREWRESADININLGIKAHSTMDESTVNTKKKKKSLFKRIAKGISTKKKKKHPDDASVMGVSVSNSVAGSVVANNAPNSVLTTITASPPIQVILLLMDPDSRRFELLQLEFDATKALVSDVLLQVEQSATETALRDMKYAGICDRTGMEMIASCKLLMFCSPGKNEIVLAMPRGMDGRETAKLATPILEDEKVVEMVSLF